jgi:hypothetical protein
MTARDWRFIQEPTGPAQKVSVHRNGGTPDRSILIRGNGRTIIAKVMAGREVMRLETSATRIFRHGLIAIVAAAFSIALAIGNMPSASAQSDDASQDAATSAPGPNGADDADQKPQSDGDQQARDSADAAQATLDSATETRDQLESDGASQDEIDAANQAIAQARANKDAADAAAQSSDDATSQSETK